MDKGCLLSKLCHMLCWIECIFGHGNSNLPMIEWLVVRAAYGIITGVPGERTLLSQKASRRAVGFRNL
jgi:hypothetical protein